MNWLKKAFGTKTPQPATVQQTPEPVTALPLIRQQLEPTPDSKFKFILTHDLALIPATFFDKEVTQEYVIKHCVSVRDKEDRVRQCQLFLSKIQPPIDPKDIATFTDKCNLDIWRRLYISELYLNLPTTPEMSFEEYWNIMQIQMGFFTTIFMYECNLPFKIKPVATWEEFWRIVDKKFTGTSINYLINIAMRVVQEAPTPEQVIEYSKLAEYKEIGTDIIQKMVTHMTPIKSRDTYSDLRQALHTGGQGHCTREDISKITDILKEKLDLLKEETKD
jgi:hypothetical protein